MNRAENTHEQRLLRRGDRVCVRSYGEISRTLDGSGCLDALPFMPAMAAYCGQCFEVAGRLDKICVEDPRFGFRSMSNVVVLKGLECSGADHGGCQRACRLLWKASWLRRTDGDCEDAAAVRAGRTAIDAASLPTRRKDGRYICQSSELVRATFDEKRTLGGKWASEYLSGNVSLARGISLMVVPAYLRMRERVTGVPPWQIRGALKQTPSGELGLQPGDWVEVKSLDEIRGTLSRNGKNRGLTFTRMMAAFCGKRFRVKGRVEKIILEGSGEMRTLHGTVLLDGVNCDGGIFHGGCSRGTYHFWREIWLRRLDHPSQP